MKYLILISITIWLAVFADRNNNLKIIACDVGQGDAILITKGTTQILIDGGPSSKVIECLNKYMAFWDRNVEMVVLTHPQKDHFGGLTHVFQKYSVGVMLENGKNASSLEYQVLQNVVGGSSVKVIEASELSTIGYGVMHLDILHPTEDFNLANSNSNDPNIFSVVLLLNFQEFDALFTGDISPSISDLVADKLLSGISDIEYLKVPHHGSKNGMSQKLLDVVDPKLAVISSGKNNRFGHPDKEILKMLEGKGIKILRTDQKGDIVVETNGREYWIDQ